MTGRRQTEEFAPDARVIHIDIDPAEIGKNICTEVPVVGDIKSVLTALMNRLRRRSTSFGFRR